MTRLKKIRVNKMLDFLVNNWINIIIGGVLLTAVVIAVVKIARNKRSRKGCGGDCSKCGGCSGGSGCSSMKKGK